MTTKQPLLPSGPLITFATRLKPKDDLVSNLLSFVKRAMEQSSSQSAFMVSVVGSLECVKIRMANTGKRMVETPSPPTPSSPTKSKNEIREWNERLEIVSLVGTFDMDGGYHLHMSVSDAKGHVFGGHLMGGQIFTTCELVVGCTPGIQFTRPLDDDPINGTGFNELVVDHQISPPPPKEWKNTTQTHTHARAK